MSERLEIREISTGLVADEDHGRDFGHHPQFRTRYSSAHWSYTRIEVPATSLRCRYGNLGTNLTPGGITAALGTPAVSLLGTPLVDLADQIRARAQTTPGFLNEIAIQKVIQLMLLGGPALYALPQAMKWKRST